MHSCFVHRAILKVRISKQFTPDFLSKKHLNFGQGLEFLKFGQGNRGLNQQNRRQSKDTMRTNKGKRGKNDKTIRVRDSNFLFKNILCHMFSVSGSYQDLSQGFYQIVALDLPTDGQV